MSLHCDLCDKPGKLSEFAPLRIISHGHHLYDLSKEQVCEKCQAETWGQVRGIFKGALDGQ